MAPDTGKLTPQANIIDLNVDIDTADRSCTKETATTAPT